MVDTSPGRALRRRTTKESANDAFGVAIVALLSGVLLPLTILLQLAPQDVVPWFTRWGEGLSNQVGGIFGAIVAALIAFFIVVGSTTVFGSVREAEKLRRRLGGIGLLLVGATAPMLFYLSWYWAVDNRWGDAIGWLPVFAVVTYLGINLGVFLGTDDHAKLAAQLKLIKQASERTDSLDGRKGSWPVWVTILAIPAIAALPMLCVPFFIKVEPGPVLLEFLCVAGALLVAIAGGGLLPWYLIQGGFDWTRWISFAGTSLIFGIGTAGVLISWERLLQGAKTNGSASEDQINAFVIVLLVCLGIAFVLSLLPRSLTPTWLLNVTAAGATARIATWSLRRARSKAELRRDELRARIERDAQSDRAAQTEEESRWLTRLRSWLLSSARTN